jgi:hypothetical protein
MTKQGIVTVGDLAKDANAKIKTTADAKKWWAAMRRIITTGKDPAIGASDKARSQDFADKVLESRVYAIQDFLTKRAKALLLKQVDEELYS